MAAFEPFCVTGPVSRFDGDRGWFYVAFGPAVTDQLRPLVAECWPSLLKVSARIAETAWEATVMPIKDGPLFIAIPSGVRERLHIVGGEEVTVHVTPTTA